MQEEVENRTVNLAISTTKLTFRTIVNGYNAWKRHHQAKVAQKTSQLPIGKQSIKELIGQNQGVSSIPIEKTDLKGFEQVARKYGVDTASIYTHDSRLIKKLRELRKQYPEQFILEHREHGSVTYTIPKRCVGIRPPYSEKRREQQRQEAKENGLPFMEKGEMNDGKN